MRHVPVTSSNLASVAYDPSSHTLEVAFNNGGLYRYAGVPAAVHQGLMAAASHGSYFAAHIRNRYPTTKIR
ncbi:MULTISPECIES: KTSC domain-containing protein [unclassified Deinococcus]|uniref:KTSC domain-containing protein n=1 Tax=unclassified Deinococcus TaxID=2623546 RepID=UPI001C2F248E|nr:MULTISPECIES: KTSC domain-containing protein [unclassified Deinococcus]MDK2014636.1 KTSC domain-containing protein [Deinococcus sp. 43]